MRPIESKRRRQLPPVSLLDMIKVLPSSLIKQITAWAADFKTFGLAMTMQIICFMLLNSMKKRIKDGSTTGETEIFDLGMGLFTRQEAYEMLKEYGTKGRELYLIHTLFEMVPYMFTYACFYAIMMSQVCALTFGRQSRFNYVILLPFVTLLFDAVENCCVTMMLVSYPKLVPEFIINVLTASIKLKWIANIIFFALFVLILIFAIPAIAGLEPINRSNEEEAEDTKNTENYEEEDSKQQPRRRSKITDITAELQAEADAKYAKRFGQPVATKKKKKKK